MRYHNTIIHNTIITGKRKDAGKKHNYPAMRKKRQGTGQNSYFDTNPDLQLSKVDQESVCAMRTSLGLSCRNCKYYQHKYCLYDHGLMID